MTIDIRNRETIPITVEFTDDKTTAITVEFKAKYLKRRRKHLYVGDGYVGDRFANERL